MMYLFVAMTCVFLIWSLVTQHVTVASFSCQRFCGDPLLHLPCSCQDVCLVYKNCCEHFQMDCPHVYQEGLARYKDLVQREVTCTNYGVLVISSCPESVRALDSAVAFDLTQTSRHTYGPYANGPNISSTNFKSSKANSTLVNGHKANSTGVNGHKANSTGVNGHKANNTGVNGHKANNTGVNGHKANNTGVNGHKANSTGINGPNTDSPDPSHHESSQKRYHANSLEYLQVVEEHRPVTDTVTRLVFKNIQIIRCNNINSSNTELWLPISPAGNRPSDETVTLDSTVYISPTHGEHVQTCVPHAVSNCPEHGAFTNPDVQRKCQLLTSYVQTGLGMFKNRYCHFCHAGHYRATHVHNIYPRTNLEFNVLFSVSSYRTVKFSLLTPRYHPGGWTEAICPIHNTSLDDSVLGHGCTVLRCLPGFSLQPDGQCQELYLLRFGVVNTEMNLSEPDSSRLPALYSCWLQNTLGKTLEKILDHRLVFDARTNRTLTVIDLFVYLTHTKFNAFITDGEYISNMPAALNEFQKIRSTADVLIRRPKDVIVSHDHTNLHAPPTNLSYVTSCFSGIASTARLHHVSVSSFLECNDALTYNRSSKIIQDFLRSDCLSLFSASSSNIYYGCHKMHFLILVSVLMKIQLYSQLYS